MTTERVDVAIAGGGPAGMALALAATAAGAKVVLIDPRSAPTARDARPIALSYGSRLILERVRAWEALSPATPIEKIHVSQRGAFGRALLSAADARVPALGYVVDYAGLVGALTGAVTAAGVPWIQASLSSIHDGGDHARLTCQGAPSEIDAALVVVADGGAFAGVVEAEVRDYGQTAITARLVTTRPHGNVAYERFTTGGPLALLPYGDEYALVWSVRTAEAEMLAATSADAFLKMLQERFGERVGRFTRVSARALHPLTLRIAGDVPAADRVVLIGNAAQALHPVAGQGLNLALRDAWELAREIAKARANGEVLAAFRARRIVDRTATIAFTDALASVFAADFAPLAFARGAGLALVDNFPPVKDFLVRRMMFGARG